MPKIRCHYLDCLFLDDRYCTAAAIELNPDTGCQTYTPDEETGTENWEDEDLDEWEPLVPEDETEEWEEEVEDEEEEDEEDESEEY
jgi:formate hydrogenlyase subunit 6/NADH:ubiquinone oxidoreductase subunit I